MRKLVPVLIGCMAVATGASAQQVVVTGGDGAILSMSPQSLYRALGDRLVDGDDVIGNGALDWNRVDPSLPSGRIGLNLPFEVDDRRVLDAVRLGCKLTGGSTRACGTVGLRRDRIVREGGYFEDGGIGAQVARLEAQRIEEQAERDRQMADENMAVVTTSIETVVLPPPAPVPVPPPPPPPAAMIEMAVPAVAAPVPKPPAPVTASIAESIAPAPGRVQASRLFLGRSDFPPGSFAAYGMIVFPTQATSEDRGTYLAICEAFFSALTASADIAAPQSAQMVTVWPVDDRRKPRLLDELNTTRAQEGSCDKAVDFYDVQVARGAMGDAMATGLTLPGRGPFLLAWAPSGMKGQPDAIVLAADMSDVKTIAEAKDVLRIWREDIEQDPELWENGFSVEKIRVKLRQIVNRYGDGLLKFMGG